MENAMGGRVADHQHPVATTPGAGHRALVEDPCGYWEASIDFLEEITELPILPVGGLDVVVSTGLDLGTSNGCISVLEDRSQVVIVCVAPQQGLWLEELDRHGTA